MLAECKGDQPTRLATLWWRLADQDPRESRGRWTSSKDIPNFKRCSSVERCSTEKDSREKGKCCLQHAVKVWELDQLDLRLAGLRRRADLGHGQHTKAKFAGALPGCLAQVTCSHACFPLVVTPYLARALLSYQRAVSFLQSFTLWYPDFPYV